MILDIEILVADEIISMLDASTRIDVLNILGDLKERGLGVLFVTHDLALGNYISDRVVILKHGRIVEMGPTPKVFANPVHPYTRMLLTCVAQLTAKWEPTAAEPDDVGTKTLQPRRRRPLRGEETASAHHIESAHHLVHERELRREGAGYGVASEWAPFDAATNAAFEPLETFAQRFDQLLATITGIGFDTIDLWFGHLNWRWATPSTSLERARLSLATRSASSLAGAWAPQPTIWRRLPSRERPRRRSDRGRRPRAS